MMERLTIYWNTKLLDRYPGYLERIRRRFGITKGMTVNGETDVEISEEDMPDLLATERAGYITIRHKPQQNGDKMVNK